MTMSLGRNEHIREPSHTPIEDSTEIPPVEWLSTANETPKTVPEIVNEFRVKHRAVASKWHDRALEIMDSNPKPLPADWMTVSTQELKDTCSFVCEVGYLLRRLENLNCPITNSPVKPILDMKFVDIVTQEISSFLNKNRSYYSFDAHLGQADHELAAEIVHTALENYRIRTEGIV